jgi:rhodanese-related sulfurtransferase
MEMMASGEDFILVDVRAQAEFDEGHIEGALLLPVDQIETLSVEQLPNKDAVILVYCRSGSRSAQASKILVELGYINVYDFGGIIDWPGEIVK